MGKKTGEPCCTKEQSYCCKIESILTIDERGQMVLPKEVRERANIKAGDKLALISWEKNATICCFALIKSDGISDIVKGILKPIMNEVI